MKVLALPIEMVSWTNLDGVINPVRFKIANEDESISVIIIDKVITIDKEKLNLGVGQGKSTLLIKFVKYMYTMDKQFSSVIVKRTLKEGREFCMEVGFKKESLNKRFDILFDESNRRQEVEDIYFGNSKLQEKAHEDYFVPRLIRGFNYTDCLKWKDPNVKKNYIEKLSSQYVDYSPILCRDCEETCGAKLSKWSVDKHPSLVITHQRLFISNDLEEIMENISGRGILIIDEKVETKDIGNILLQEWEDILTKVKAVNLSREVKNQISGVEEYIKTLNYPDTSGSGIIRVNKEFDSKFRFNSSIYGVLSEKYEDVVSLNSIEKFLNYGGSTSRSWSKKDRKQFSYIRYIDLNNYSKHFKKTIILDATSRIDSDYKKSNIIFLDGLQMSKGKLNLFYSNQRTSKSALIYSNNSKTNENNKLSNKAHRNYEGNKEFYSTNINLLAQEVEEVINTTLKDTLIICYKQIVDRLGNIFTFEEDLNNSIKSLNTKDIKCTVRHFGAATTGVNDFKDYGNIIFLGMFNKGELYYINKGISIGNEGAGETRINEYVIDCIQQIGRICVRQGITANVYMLFKDNLGLVDKLKENFDIKDMEWHPKYFNGINNATDFKKETCWYEIVEELKKLKVGRLSLTDLQSRLSKFKHDTVYKSISNPHVQDYMITNKIIYNRKKKIFTKKFTMEGK